MDRRGKVPLEIEKVIKRQEVTETDMERGRFFGDIAEMRLTREKNYASIIKQEKRIIDTERGGLKMAEDNCIFVRLQGGDSFYNCL